MSDYEEFDEEEFSSSFTQKTFSRIVELIKPHSRSFITFLSAIAIVSILDGYFTFLSKRIIDEGIVLKNA